jgi:4-carboxymuconolactone decarboxylase
MRLPHLTPDKMTPRQRELSERITGRRGHTRGPYIAWLYSPGMADRAEALAAYARYECSLSRKLREFSILITARFWDAQYSWNSHLNKAIEAGIAPEIARAIAEKRRPVFSEDDERVFFDFSMEMLENHFVSDATFNEAQAIFGNEGLVDIVGCIGNFSMLAMLLNTFQVDLQPGCEPPFPDVRGFGKVQNIGRRS